MKIYVKPMYLYLDNKIYDIPNFMIKICASSQIHVHVRDLQIKIMRMLQHGPKLENYTSEHNK